jgi:hypothetical protein
MPDRDDIFGRYWLNDRRGIHYTAEKASLMTSSVPEKLRLYYGLNSAIYPQMSYSRIVECLMTEDGRADIERRSARSQAMPQAKPVKDEPAACDMIFDHKADIEYRLAGHADDPLNGVAMRQTIEGGLVALRLNLTEFWRLKTEARRHNIRFALGLPLITLGGFGLAGTIRLKFIPGMGQEALGLLHLAAWSLPFAGLIAGSVWAAMRKERERAAHKEWSAGLPSVLRRNAVRIKADMAEQKAYIQGLVEESLLHAGLCTDEVRINEQTLASAAEHKALLGRVARLLKTVLAGHYEYQRICHYLMVSLAEGIESAALYRAFYHDLGSVFRVHRGFLRGLVLGSMVVVSLGATALLFLQLSEMPARVGLATGLMACLVSIGQASVLMAGFDDFFRGGLHPDLVAEITDPGPQGPSPGGHFETRQFEADRIETVHVLAQEERCRLFGLRAAWLP